MNREDIIKFVRAAEWSGIYSHWVSSTEREHLTVPVTMEQIERFATLVAEHEREKCAKVCEDEDVAPTDDPIGVQWCIAESIRKRK